jgi:hypothetical protein
MGGGLLGVRVARRVALNGGVQAEGPLAPARPDDVVRQSWELSRG